MKNKAKNQEKLFDFAFAGHGWYNWDATVSGARKGPPDLRGDKRRKVNVILADNILESVENDGIQAYEPVSRSSAVWRWGNNTVNPSDNIIAWTYADDHE